MICFFDTSVLVATFQSDHPHHLPSLKAFAPASIETSACSIHTLAEVYSAMSAMPVKPAPSPDQILHFMSEITARLAPVALTADEYLSSIRDAAARGITGGKIYDCLILACARKCKAEVMYTWNTKHFLRIAPDLARQIQTP